MTFTISELHTKQQILTTYELIHEMYNNISFQDFSYKITEMIKLNNYAMVAGHYQQELVVVSGYWVSMMFYCGKYLQISNFITSQKYRSKGFGSKILQYLQEKAISLQCNKIVLDSYIENKKSHSLYYKQGFYVRGLHFMKDL
jgi:ribosomal protein S18 acetylase RimI-like enzyme